MPTKHKPKPAVSPRVVEKRVPMELLRKWFPTEESRGGLGIGTLWNIIGDQYCRNLVRRGFCPVDCGQCEYEIIDMPRWENPKNKEALLTWTAKDHAARMAERQASEQKHQQFPVQETLQDAYSSMFPQRGESRNIFLELKDLYEDPNKQESK